MEWPPGIKKRDMDVTGWTARALVADLRRLYLHIKHGGRANATIDSRRIARAISYIEQSDPHTGTPPSAPNAQESGDSPLFVAAKCLLFSAQVDGVIDRCAAIECGNLALAADKRIKELEKNQCKCPPDNNSGAQMRGVYDG